MNADVSAVIDGITNAVASLVPTLEKWRKTSHGENPWSASALSNVLALEKHFIGAVEMVGVSHTSCYRHPAINKAAGGVPESRHQYGAAIDIVPRKELGVDKAAGILIEAARAGKLGPVREIVREHKNGIVHVDWHTDGARGAPTLVTDGRY